MGLGGRVRGGGVRSWGAGVGSNVVCGLMVAASLLGIALEYSGKDQAVIHGGGVGGGQGRDGRGSWASGLAVLEG